MASLARHLPAHGWRPTAALLEPGPLERWLSEAGCETVVLAPHRTREVHRSLATVWHLRQLVRSTHAHVVLSNMDKGHLFGGVAALWAQRAAVLWQHGIPAGTWVTLNGGIEKVSAIVPKSAVIAGSDLAVLAQRRLTKAPVHKVALGIAVSEVAVASGKGQSIRADFGWGGDTVIGIVGRLQPWKGQEVFLKAATLLIRDHPGLRFCLVGGAILGWEGSYESDLKAYVNQHAILQDRVHFAGHQDNVYAWIDALDIVVHASWNEPFGLVVVEAMALGKPIIATNAGGPTEIVEDGVSGLLVQAGDPDALAKAVCRLLDRPDLSDRLSVHARQRASHFTEERMAAEIAAVLNDLVPAP